MKSHFLCREPPSTLHCKWLKGPYSLYKQLQTDDIRHSRLQNKAKEMLINVNNMRSCAKQCYNARKLFAIKKVSYTFAPKFISRYGKKR